MGILLRFVISDVIVGDHISHVPSRSNITYSVLIQYGTFASIHSYNSKVKRTLTPNLARPRRPIERSSLHLTT
jgi:hypothetical protein